MASRIAELASLVTTTTAILDSYLAENGKPSPSFNINAPVNLGIAPEAEKIEKARVTALSACIELHDLLLGPQKLMTTIVRSTKSI